MIVQRKLNNHLHASASAPTMLSASAQGSLTPTLGLPRGQPEQRAGAGAPLTRIALILILAAVPPVLGAGETLYVVDRLRVGIHRSQSLDSAILELVPTGTPLEVIEREGDFARVRTPDGTEGWVDGRYLMSEKPASLQVLELEAEHRETVRALEQTRAELDVVRTELAELRSRPAESEAARTGNAPAAEELAAASHGAGAQAADGPMTEALREIQQLAEENRRLKARIAELRAADSGASPPGAQSGEQSGEQSGAQSGDTAAGSSGTLIAQLVPSLATWQWALLGFIVLLAFGLGGYLVDWGVRRRHGGFRV